MADFFDHLNERHIAFIQAQPMFFTATGCAEGRHNLSPKGMADTFDVIDPNTVAWLDLTGSGNETAAHLRHDGRITLMFCSFDRSALILRIYGTGEVARPGSKAFEAHKHRFPELPGTRQITFVTVESVQTSCGYAVPKMQLVEERDTLVKWEINKGEDGVADYQHAKNVKSIDGFETGIFK